MGTVLAGRGGADRAAPGWTGAVFEEEIPLTLKATPHPPAALPRPEDSARRVCSGRRGARFTSQHPSVFFSVQMTKPRRGTRRTRQW